MIRIMEGFIGIIVFFFEFSHTLGLAVLVGS